MEPVVPAVVVAPKYNTHLNDALGAFQPQARAFMKRYSLPASSLLLFDSSARLAARALEFEAFMRDKSGLRTVAFFCHGWRDGIQAGFVSPGVKALADAIARCAAEDLRVVLYACDTARVGSITEDPTEPGPGAAGGFADLLQNAIEAAGVKRCWVYGHGTTGHTTNNPFVRVFRPQNPAPGGDWLYTPRGPLWGVWARALRTTDLWARFPFMTKDEIDAELTSRPGVA